MSTAPNATAPNATAPNATAPNATAPTAPNATAPNATTSAANADVISMNSVSVLSAIAAQMPPRAPVRYDDDADVDVNDNYGDAFVHLTTDMYADLTRDGPAEVYAIYGQDWWDVPDSVAGRMTHVRKVHLQPRKRGDDDEYYHGNDIDDDAKIVMYEYGHGHMFCGSGLDAVYVFVPERAFA